MTATNKAFAYVFNTSQEDQKVARWLSGWQADSGIPCLSLRCFDPVVHRRFSNSEIYSSCHAFRRVYDVVEVLMASLILHYADVLRLQNDPSTGYVARMRRCFAYLAIDEQEFLTWGELLHFTLSTRSPDTKPPQLRDPPSVQDAFEQQQKFIVRLLDFQRTILERIERLEAKFERAHSPRPTQVVQVTPAASEEGGTREVRLCKAPPKRLCDAWFDWRASQPPLYAKGTPLKRQDKHEHKMLVAFTSLFLSEGTLNEGDADFHDRVHAYGERAEAGLLAYLRGCGIDASSIGTVVRAMRELYRHGVLDDHIRAYCRLVREGVVCDHLPQQIRADHLLPAIGIPADGAV